jgi:hypothetical protein
MANATVLSLGQINGAGATDALFLKLFSGEVLTAFNETNVMTDKQIVRTIQRGKSAAFPATWKVTARYHAAGAEIVGQTSPKAERIINIDNLLMADVFLDVLDEAMDSFEVRGEYAKQCGDALARVWDRNTLQVGVLAARAAATVTGANGGTTLTSATTLYRTSSTDLVAGINAAAQAMDEKDIPASEVKYTYVRPAQWYLLSQSTGVQNKDFVDGGGKLGTAQLPQIGGTSLVKTNNLPITDLTASQTADMKNTYNADFSKTAFLTMTRQAVGTVKLFDLATEITYDPRRQGHLIVAKYAVGTGILRPECAVEGKTTT